MNKDVVSKGDIFEVPTSKGLAYIQYTHFHPEWDALVRVLQGFYPYRLDNDQLHFISQKQHRFSLFLCLSWCVSHKCFRNIGNFPLSKYVVDFPTFKTTSANMNDIWDAPEKVMWRLWDGEKEYEPRALSREEQKKYPEPILCSDVTLSYYIETGQSLGEDLL